MPSRRRPRVLIFTRYYLPGVNGGGPVVSVSNMVSALSAGYDFYIVTPDTDIGEREPMPDVVSEEWQRVGEAEVYYVRASGGGPRRLAALIRQVDPDLIYLNSFFSYRWTILPLLLVRAGVADPAIIVVPRGELALGALKNKGWKKRPYVLVARLIGLYRNVLWQATNVQETDEIRSALGPDTDVHVAHNIPRSVDPSMIDRRPGKKKGYLRLVFLSRIHPKKNLRGAIQALMHAKSNIKFDIFGPVEDRRYWEECKRLLSDLPSNVLAEYLGRVESADVAQVMARYDAFFLPTLSENFGHVIFESLASGTPVIVSDQTPWRDLAKRHAGFDLQLSDPHSFAQKIDLFAMMDAEEFGVWSTGAISAARDYLRDADILAESESLFRRAITNGSA